MVKIQENLDNPPKVTMITESIQKQPHRDSLADAFASAAIAIAKVFFATSHTNQLL